MKVTFRKSAGGLTKEPVPEYHSVKVDKVQVGYLEKRFDYFILCIFEKQCCSKACKEKYDTKKRADEN